MRSRDWGAKSINQQTEAGLSCFLEAAFKSFKAVTQLPKMYRIDMAEYGAIAHKLLHTETTSGVSALMPSGQNALAASGE